MYDNNNIFKKIIEGNAECKKVYEDDRILAFEDKFPSAPIHVLVIPKRNYTSIVDFIEANGEEEIGYFFKKVKEIAESLNLNENGYRILTNHGNDANQIVKHFHVHIIGGKKL